MLAKSDSYPAAGCPPLHRVDAPYDSNKVAGNQIMSISFDTTAFDRGTDFLLELLTAEQAESLIAYGGDDAFARGSTSLLRRATREA